MSGSIDEFKKSYKGSTGSRFIGTQERRDLVAKGLPFYVIRIGDAPNNFDPEKKKRQWVFECAPMNGDPAFALTLGQTDYRNQLVEFLQSTSLTNGGKAGPYRLTYGINPRTGRGQYDLADWQPVAGAGQVPERATVAQPVGPSLATPVATVPAPAPVEQAPASAGGPVPVACEDCGKVIMGTPKAIGKGLWIEHECPALNMDLKLLRVPV